MGKCSNVVERHKSNPAPMDSRAATDGTRYHLLVSRSFFPVVAVGKIDRVL